MRTLATMLSVIALLGVSVGASTASHAEAGYGLPAVETLGADSDYSGFMHAGVPEALRVQALRKLWRSHPAIGAVDELSDYGSDLKVVELEPSETRNSRAAAEPSITIEGPALPATESLDQDSDFSVFMQPDVPESIKHRALSKLWRSHPYINRIDDLSDYGDDLFTTTVVESQAAPATM